MTNLKPQIVRRGRNDYLIGAGIGIAIMCLLASMMMVPETHKERQKTETKTEVVTKRKITRVKPYEVDRNLAFVMSQKVCKAFLVSPSTASFGGIFSNTQLYTDVTTYQGDRKYRIRAWVDSQNAYGATIRNRYDCVMRHELSDTWSMVSIDFR